MRPMTRQQKILEKIHADERVFVDDLANLFATSGETIRRDLNELARQGLIRKFHGGATRPPHHERENAFTTRLNEFASEKKRLAQYAIQFFADGESLFIDTGTTTLLFARELAKAKQELSIITNSTAIAQEVAQYDHRVFLLGGAYNHSSNQSLGPIATAQVKMFSTQHLVSTIGALNCDGAADFSLEEAQMTQAMYQNTQQITVIADHSKLDRRALFKVFELHNIDRLITDKSPSDELKNALTKANVEIHIVESQMDN